MELEEGLKRNLKKAIGKEINVRIADDVTAIGILVDINDSALMLDEDPYVTLVPLRFLILLIQSMRLKLIVMKKLWQNIMLENQNISLKAMDMIQMLTQRLNCLMR